MGKGNNDMDPISLHNTGGPVRTDAPRTEGDLPAEGAGRARPSGKGDAVTLTEAPPTTKPPSAAPVDLPPVKGRGNGVLLGGAIDKLKDVNNDFSAILGGGAGGTMFDIAKLAALIIQVAQKHRDTAQVTRWQMATLEMSQLQGQAAELRSAANTTMVMGIVSGAIGLVGAVGSGVLTGMSMKAKLSAADQAHVGEARANLDAAMKGNDNVAKGDALAKLTQVGNAVAIDPKNLKTDTYSTIASNLLQFGLSPVLNFIGQGAGVQQRAEAAVKESEAAARMGGAVYEDMGAFMSSEQEVIKASIELLRSVQSADVSVEAAIARNYR